MSGSALRMRRHRLRRLRGLRCLTIELRESEILALNQRGLIEPHAHDDPSALRKALYDFLDQSLAMRTYKA